MDDLLREFVTETNESLDVVDVELVRFEQEPSNAKILDHIFRLVHTIKGTCGFLNLPRLEALAHAAETVMGKFRSGATPSTQAVSLILATIDRIKDILAALERERREPDGDDADLITSLVTVLDTIDGQPAAPTASVADYAIGTLVPQVLERPLRPGEVSLDELERVFQETPVDPILARAHATPVKEKEDDGVRPGVQSLRVPLETLEQLMTTVSELVLTRNQLLEIVRRQEDSEFKVPLQRLSNVTAQLQEGVMKTRMQPIGNAWQKLPRIVRDLSAELGKQIDLEMHGAETELDRQVLDLIKDPLTHMVRNSADHGLETPAERRAAGKPEHGLIRLSAYQEGGQIVIEIADDGRGLNTERIKAKAVSQGLASAAEVGKLSETQIHKFIFAPGFSTATEVTSVSGRGVGMDVVGNNIDQIGGTIDVRSIAGEGVSFIIKIPLTLAIVSALIVEAGGERFAIPQLSVSELVKLRSDGEQRIEYIKDTAVLRLRDRLLPVAKLTTLLGLDTSGALNSGFIVVIEFDSQCFGIVVDSVFHTEEVVVKPMSSKLRNIAMFSGNTILGDGAVIMIIDPNGVVQSIGATVATQLAAAAVAAKDQPSTAAQAATSLLLFRAGSSQQKAVPLSLITRLEEIDTQTIELSNGRHMVQYRGHLMPLVGLDNSVRVKGEGTQPLLVFSDGSRSMALLVDEIVDIVEEHLDIEPASASPGVLGSAIIKGQATEIIDVGHFVPEAFADWFRGAGRPASAAKPSVLLVDDSPFYRNMLMPVLQAAGYEVTAVARATEALDLIDKGRTFNAVVTDIEMPEMDGFAFAEHLRADERTAALPVVALSAVVTADFVERGRVAGFDDYVAKFDRPGLIAALKEQIGMSAAA
ncbi:MAG: Signal transduction histidine kinase CheA / CheY-like domain [Pseudolabrys sp.]|jgi:two-component system chemotaxis sensor kinase CheA|nr:Signal transduction histidine kinase CheA / CheY-like domain [Pseudolabrys sp.]